jgi:uncharacterized membrane protein YkvA (DUF1232 family)
MGRTLDKLKDWARATKRDTIAVYLAARDPRIPWGVKLLAASIAAYALSPIDLIPDFIPVLGYIDDLILLPAAIWVAVRLIDPQIMAEHRAAAEKISQRPISRAGAAMIAGVWVAAAALAAWFFWPAGV